MHCTTSVRNGVLLLGRHLGKGAIEPLGNKQRVVAESLGARLVVDDAPLDNPLEEVLLAPLDQADHRAEAGATIRLAREVFQQKAVVWCLIIIACSSNWVTRSALRTDIS